MSRNNKISQFIKFLTVFIAHKKLKIIVVKSIFSGYIPYNCIGLYTIQYFMM